MKKLLLLFTTVISLSISANGQSPEESYEKGFEYAQAGNYGVAIRYFTDGINSSLKNSGNEVPRIFFKNLSGRALSKFNNDDYYGAISDWNLVLEKISGANKYEEALNSVNLQGYRAYAYLNRGGAYRFIDEHEKACRDLRTAADIGSPKIKDLAYQEMEYEGCM